MRYIICILSVLLFGCAQSTGNASKNSKKNKEYARLLSRFKEISFDTMHVFPFSDNMDDKDETKYKFHGIQLDSADAVLFPEDIAEHHFMDPPGLFACYKFKIDSIRTGLIARTPSEYYPSSIKLFIYTINKDTLITANELAQFIGDAGALLEINSWIFKDAGKKFKVFTWSRDSQDNSVLDEKDTTIYVADHFGLYDIATDRSESLGTKPKHLPTKLGALLRQSKIALD